MASLSLQNITKKYDNKFTAVRDFSLDIENEEFIVLVGPSGCGKSTALRMIAGLEEITGGNLFIDGQRVNDVPSKNRDIAMVFQNYALYPHMTVFANMAFSLKMRKTKKPEIEARVKEAAKILDIEHLLDRKPRALSGGQRQRVALGRAIVRHPKVFLMDEPLSNLDAKLRVQMRTEIAKLHQKMHTTFIYVTHDQTEAMTMGTKIVVMKDGEIQQVGDPQFVYNAPHNLFVAQFIGSPQMNIARAVLKEDGNGLCAELGQTRIPVSASARERLRVFCNREICLGIRPEDFHAADGAQIPLHEPIRACVEVLEPIGSDTYLYVSLEGFDGNTIMRMPPAFRVKIGERIPVTVDIEKMHFFDAETGVSLLGENTLKA